MKLPSMLLSSLALAVVGLLPIQDAEPVRGSGDTPVVKLAEGQTLPFDPGVPDLAFLSGSWRGTDGQSEWEAVYSSAEAGQLVGASKEMRDGRTVMIDFEHFYERDGQLRLTPYPFGKRSVEFTLSAFSGAHKTAVFENADHDFPKRFTYQRVSATRLSIELVGEMGGQEMRVELELDRTDG